MFVIHLRRRIAFAVLTWLTVTPVWADPAPSYHTLLRHLDEMPAAIEASALHEAALARVEQAATRPNPTLSLESEGAFGSGNYSGYKGADTTFAISQPLELWGQRNARIDAAKATADAVKFQSEVTRQSVVSRLAIAYAEAEASQIRYNLALEALSLAQEDANAAEIFVEEGREARLRTIQAKSETARAQADLDEALANRDAAFAYLTAFSMLEQPAISITDSLLNKNPSSDQHHDISLSPTMRVVQAELDAAKQFVTVESLRARPDVTASIGVQRFEETHDEALTFGVSVTLPLFDKNKGNIKAAQAEQRAAEARVRAQSHEDSARRQAALARLVAANSRTQAADSSVETAIEAYHLARIGFEAGRISSLELRSSRIVLNTVRHLAVDARLARVFAEIELAALEGRVPFEGI